jgi:uncharacterized protein YeaO (DUF488 family)
MLRLKRVYEAADPDDGFRVLVDRLWPRGLTKEKAHIDLWLKEVAPSDELRKWFGHEPDKWPAFRERYFRELESRSEELGQLRDLIAKGPVTLVYAAKDTEHNQAVALRDFVLANRVAKERTRVA